MRPAESAPPVAWRATRAVSTLIGAAVLAFVVAQWGWHWFGPRASPLPIAGAMPESLAPIITAAPWFGAPAARPQDAGSAPAPAAGLDGDVRLLGTIADATGHGYALFRFPDRGPALIATGQEIERGVTLDSVSAAGVRVSDHGAVREIALRAPKDAAPAAMTRAAPIAAQRVASNAACTPAGAGNGPRYRLNAELLSGIAAKPESWSGAFSTGTGGLAVREGNAFGAMLGMKAGDRIAQANGVPLRGTEDVVVAVIRPLLASQPVRVTGLRDNRPIEWIFVNASACPA